MSKYKHAFALLGSARQFLESAVRHALERDHKEWKFALLHATTALELLAKARIAFEDPHQIVRGRVDDLRLERGDFQSINLDKAFKRLEKITGFSLSAKHKGSLAKMNAERNRLVHFTGEASAEATKALVASGLAIFLELHEAEFRDEEEPYGARSITDLVQDLSKFRDFVAGRMDGLMCRLKTAERPRTLHLAECQSCLQEADVIIGDAVVCLFCGYRATIREWAELISEDRSVEDCPVCHRPAVAKYHSPQENDATYECFCCGYFRGPEIKWGDGTGGEVPRLRTFDAKTLTSNKVIESDELA